MRLTRSLASEDSNKCLSDTLSEESFLISRGRVLVYLALSFEQCTNERLNDRKCIRIDIMSSRFQVQLVDLGKRESTRSSPREKEC